MLFLAMVNGIVSLISLSDLLLLVYRNARDFCVTLLNSLISSSSFFVAFLSFSMGNMPSVNSEFYFFSNLDSSISFSSFTAVVRTSKIILNNSCESRHPCLVPNLVVNAFSFSPLRICLLWVRHISLLSCRGRFLLCQFSEQFLGFFLIINGYWILLKAFSASVEMIILFYLSACSYGISHWFAYIEEYLHPWDKIHLIIMYNSFNVLLNFIC